LSACWHYCHVVLQRDGILAVLLKEVQVASQLEGMPQHMADAQVVEATQLCTATLVSHLTVMHCNMAGSMVNT
jgi:hypothetical protein